MKRRSFLGRALIAWGMVLVAAPVFAQGRPLERVTVSYPAWALVTTFIPQVVKVKGYFKEEGLDPQFTLVRAGAVANAALISGQLDYSIGGVSAAHAYVAGVPMRLVMSYVNGMDQLFIVNPKFKSIKELKGQTIGAQNPGGMLNIMVDEILKKHGVNPREVTTLNMIAAADRLVALKNGSIQAAVLSTPYNFEAEKAGYRVMADGNDFIGGFTGILVTGDRLKNKSDEVKRFIRALLRGMTYVRENKEDAVKIAERELKFDTETAQKGYDFLLRIMSKDGKFKEKDVQFFLDDARRRAKIDKEFKAEDFLDYTQLTQAQRDLGITR
jgi:ABC-type nitrate/sulfonate/bicarbonate transport system substrate-binding protein